MARHSGAGLILAIGALGLAGCITQNNHHPLSSLSTPGRVRIVQAGATINFVSAWRFLGVIPVYSSRSVFDGGKKLRRDPPFLLGSNGNDIVHLSISMFTPKHLPPAIVKSEVNDFILNFANAMKMQMDRVWGERNKRKFDFKYYMVGNKTQVARNKTHILFGKTFHLLFYGKHVGIASWPTALTLAHESYHLMVGALGAHVPPQNPDLRLTRRQSEMLDEVSARAFSACVALQATGRIEYMAFYDKDVNMLGDRHGTPSDAQMRRVLMPGRKIPDRDTVDFMASPLLLAWWTEYAGTDKVIGLGTPAAAKLFDLCAHHIANPQDLWPVLWKLANDGHDAPELPFYKTPVF